MDLLLVKQKQSRLLIPLLVIAITVVGFAGPSKAAAPTLPVSSAPLSVADIAEASIPKVVWISCTYEADPKPFFFGGPNSTPSKGIGSGFFIDSTGQILTNAHVVAGAQTIEVTLNGQTKPLNAKLIGSDRDLDLAIIKIESPQQTPFFKLGDSDRIRIGETVLAIGNPFGLDHTVTQGIISAKGRPLTAGDRFGGEQQIYENMLQTDAAINPGNSGGPLLNLQGEVIGINAVANANGQGLGFAIPINSVKAVLNELQTTGKVSRPWIGAYLTDVKLLNARTRAYLGIEGSNGVLIRPIKNSPAERADLQLNDVILEINHQAITTSSDLINYIRQQKIGAKVTLLVLRNRSLITVDVVLAEKP